MINIGIYGGLLYDVIPSNPKESWMNTILKKYYDKSKQGYLFEPALAKALEHKYKNIKVKIGAKKYRKSSFNYF